MTDTTTDTTPAAAPAVAPTPTPAPSAPLGIQVAFASIWAHISAIPSNVGSEISRAKFHFAECLKSVEEHLAATETIATADVTKAEATVTADATAETTATADVVKTEAAATTVETAAKSV